MPSKKAKMAILLCYVYYAKKSQNGALTFVYLGHCAFRMCNCGFHHSRFLPFPPAPLFLTIRIFYLILHFFVKKVSNDIMLSQFMHYIWRCFVACMLERSVPSVPVCARFFLPFPSLILVSFPFPIRIILFSIDR